MSNDQTAVEAEVIELDNKLKAEGSSLEEVVAENLANFGTEEVKEAAIDPLDTPEVNQAAADFNKVIPQIKLHAKSMSLRQLQRVIGAVAEFPLGNDYPKFITSKEHELFMMMLHAEGVKTIMKNAVMANTSALKEIYDTTINSIVSEQKQKLAEVTKEEGETNGLG